MTTDGAPATYTYDAAGNLTNDGLHSYAYDAENRLVSVDSGAYTYAYDHENRRVKKTAGSTITHYLWEGSMVLAEYNGATGAQQVAYYYAGRRAFARVPSGQAIQLLLSDRLSTRLVVDNAGNVIGRQGHLPPGEEMGGANQQDKHRFTSYERDGETGLDYAVNRFYSPTVERFSSVDPIFDRARTNKSSKCGKQLRDRFILNQQEWNRYTYSLNDPINRIDPLGLINWKCVWEATKCLLAIDSYIQELGGIGTVCGLSAGVACISLLLLHPIISVIMVQQCGSAIEACGFSKPPDKGPGGTGANRFDVPGGDGRREGNWGIGSTCNMFNWVANAECRGPTDSED